ncbi:MAG TPA: hypothetical protein VMT34_11375 [Aggregatilineales bacterium]|nr:hypothetical protein [Aggregatilineales bacterium]
MRKFTLIAVLIAVTALCTGVPSRAQDTTPTPVKVIFSDDFSTRANRWNTFDLGKAKIDFDETVSPSVLAITAQQSNYSLWTIPDSDLKLPRFDMQADLTFGSGGDEALAGMMLQYFSENDMTVLAITPTGEVHLGRLYFGLWRDLIPPARVVVDSGQPITLRAIVDQQHTLRIFVDDQPTGGTTLTSFKAAGFGLFAMTGETGGISAAFHRFAIVDV